MIEAPYARGAGATLVFAHPVAEGVVAQAVAVWLNLAGYQHNGGPVVGGDEDDDGVSVYADGLQLNGGTIQAAAAPTRAALLAHAELTDQPGHKVDGVKPLTDSQAGLGVDGDTLTIPYDEELDAASTPAPTAFTVTVGEAVRAVSAVSVQGRVVTLTLASSVAHGEVVTVSYAVPDGEGAAPVRDLVGNEAFALRNKPVPNNTPAPENNAPTGLPAISGTAQVGQTLTADVSGIEDADGLDGVTFSYQWVSNDGTADTDIADATQASYEVVAADVGRTLKVRVSFTDNGDTEETLVSTATAAVAPLPAVSIAAGTSPVTEGAEAAFTLSRTGDASQALTVAVSVTETGSMLDGAAPAEATFAAGAATAALDLATADDEAVEDASTVTAAVTAGDGYAVAADAGSAQVTVEDDDAAPVVTTASPIPVDENGTEVATLAATDEDTAAESLAWSLAGGADADRFTVTQAGVLAFGEAKDFEAPDDADGDGDYELTVRVTDGANPVDAALTVRLADVDDTAPALTAAAVDRTELTLTFGEALDEGSAPGAGAFSVTVAGSARGVDGVAVAGSAVTLTLASSVAHGETVTVDYTVPTGADAAPLQDTAGNAVAALSGRAVTNGTPANRAPTGLPAISGTAQVGQTLTVDVSGIEDADGLDGVTFSYQWVSNDGTADTDIADATAATYELAADDEGKTVKVRVSFTDNRDTAETLLSAATGAVAPPPPLTASLTVTGTVSEGAFTVQVSFSREVTGFEAADITAGRVGGGAAAVSGFARVAGENAWTARVATGGAGRVWVKVDRVSGALGGMSRIAILVVEVAADGAVAAVAGPAATGAYIWAPSDGAWTAGDAIEVALRFSETVIMRTDSGTPTVGLVVDGTARTAGYTRGSGGGMLHFAWTVPDGADAVSGVILTADSLALNGARIRDRAGDRDADLKHPGTRYGETAETTETTAAPALSVAGGSAAEGGSLVFTVTLAPAAESEVTVDYATADGTAAAGDDYTATSGTLTFTAGETSKTVSVSLLADAVADGGETFALRLTDPAGATLGTAEATGTIEDVASETPAADMFTASFEQMPSEHDGSSAFTFRARFSAAPGVSFRTIRDEWFAVTGGAVRKAKRVNGSNTLREIRVRPSGNGDVTLTLQGGRACTATGAICTGDGKMLSNTVTATVQGPPGLSVADARVEEGDEVTLDFAVSLNRAASGTVTVDYATSDGTATAGTDYTATSGTLTFAAGETVKTVSVPVLDDAHDEGEENLTLTLSNASGAWIEDGEATGTISNSDPLQQMWLARFGHTVGSQIVDEVSERLSRRLEGAQMTVGGQTLDLAGPNAGQALTGLARTFGEGGGVPVIGSSFHIAFSRERGGSGLVTWGRVASLTSSMQEDHRRGAVRMDNEVVTGILGLDTQWSRGIVGVALSFSDGRSRFAQQAVDSGTIEGSLTAVSPYAQLRLSERLHVWSLAGFGTGEMTIRQDRSGTPIRTDIEMQLSAVGMRGDLAQAGETGGLDLAVKADAFLVQTESAKALNTVATEAEASRLRMMLEASRTFELDRGASLAPGFELGLRQDGGNAESGAGIEVGAALAYAYAPSGLTAQLNARSFISRSGSDYEEWGVSGSLHMGGDTAGRGFLMSLAPTLGAASSSADRLWSADDAGDLATDEDFEAEGRFDAEFGYGLRAFDVLTGTPYAGLGLSETGRDWRLGWRLTPGNAPLDFSFGVEATLAQPANDNAPFGQGLMLRGAIRW